MPGEQKWSTIKSVQESDNLEVVGDLQDHRVSSFLLLPSIHFPFFGCISFEETYLSYSNRELWVGSSPHPLPYLQGWVYDRRLANLHLTVVFDSRISVETQIQCWEYWQEMSVFCYLVLLSWLQVRQGPHLTILTPHGGTISVANKE